MNTQEINHFIKKTLKILAASVLALILFGFFLDAQFAKDRTDKFTWLKGYKSESLDYAFLGSSRTLNMVDLPQIDSARATNGINLGMGGADYRTLFMILYSFTEVQGNEVKNLYLQIDPFMLYRDSLYNKPKYDHYFYDMANEDAIASCFQDESKVMLYYYLPIVKYIEYNKVYNLTHFIRSFSDASKYDKEKGSVLIEKQLPFVPEEGLTDVRLSISEEDLNYLKKILQYTKDRQIETVLYTSPIYNYETTLAPAYPGFETLLVDIQKAYELPYVDFRNQYLNQPELYKDKIHLNRRGTEMLTKVMLDKMIK